jgi:ABC-type nitrate/sulfonate/bicarbonate transport system substrate-binding protein
VVTRRSFSQENRPVVVNFMKGLIEAICYYKTHKEQSFKVMSKYMRIQDREVLEENFRAYDHSLRPYATDAVLELPIQEVSKGEPKALKDEPSAVRRSLDLERTRSDGFHRSRGGAVRPQISGDSRFRQISPTKVIYCWFHAVV